MAQTYSERAGQRPAVIGLAVRVWRVVAGAPVGLFTYAGEADATVLHAVLQVVRRLTAAVPGDWRVEVVGTGLDTALLHALENDLGDLRRRGIRPRLALAPQLRPEIKALLHAPLPSSGVPPGAVLH